MEITSVFAQLDEETRRALSGDGQSVLRMFDFHSTKHWLGPDFIGVVISALRPVETAAYLGPVVGRQGGRNWHYPSPLWWRAHAATSHPPDGTGCDVSAHVAFLTRRGSEAEFLYANVFDSKNGPVIRIAGSADFSEECAWWNS